MTSFKIQNYFTNLKQLKERHWAKSTQAREISYPDNLHQKFAELDLSSFWFKHRNRVIAELIKSHSAPGLICDVGGGVGTVAQHLASLGKDVVVVEPDSDGAIVCLDRGLTVIEGNFDETIVIAKSIPNICLFDVIEHIEDCDQFLKTCFDANASGGRIFITVPAMNFLWSSEDEFAGHYRRYNSKKLKEQLAKAGYEEIYMGYFFLPLVPAIYFLRSLPSRLGFGNVIDGESTIKSHKSSIPSSAAYNFLWLEYFIVKIGMHLPFGSSLIAVAKKAD